MESFPLGPRLRDWPLIRTEMDIRSPEGQCIGSNAFLTVILAFSDFQRPLLPQ